MWKLLPKALRKALRRKTDPLDLLSANAAPGLRLHTLVHVGAHLAQERHHYEALGWRQVLWIEGSPQVHQRLAQSLDEHQAAAGRGSVCQHRSVCALLTDQEGQELALREYSNDGMSSSIFAPTSVLKERWPDLHETGQSEAQRTRTLDGLLADLGLVDVDVLVVDVQGAELLVLRGAARSLGQVCAVVSEVSTRPLYEGGVLFDALAAHLASHGFVPMSVPRRHGDMLFVHPHRAGFGP